MQDIDFDEIDRAVNSVSNNDAQTVTTTAPEEAPVEVVQSSAPALSPAARRSAGRFMDVVHPSSDMRPQSSAPSSPREEPKTVVPRTEIPERAEPAGSPAFHWPDPIDAAEPVVVPETAAVEEPAPIEAAPIVEAEPTPLESPFLTDAKVEKRPLGAFSTNEPELELLEDFPAPNTAATEITAPEEEADEPLVETAAEETESPESPTVAAVAPEPAVVEEAPVGPTSITQQYKEQPSSATETSGSIYDTEAYHQPLTHPVKKRSGVFVIIWILALILVGGGIGAGIYFVVLPMLG